MQKKVYSNVILLFMLSKKAVNQEKFKNNFELW